MRYSIIPNTNNRYVVTIEGEVVDLKAGRIVKQSYNCGNGRYLGVNINTNDGKVVIPVHRLVAEAFVANPFNKPTVDHIDRNRANNHVTNLRWATYREQYKNQGPKHKYIYYCISSGEIIPKSVICKTLNRCNSSVDKYFNKHNNEYKGFRRVKVNSSIYTP